MAWYWLVIAYFGGVLTLAGILVFVAVRRIYKRQREGQRSKGNSDTRPRRQVIPGKEETRVAGEPVKISETVLAILNPDAEE